MLPGVGWEVVLVHLIYGLPAILATIFAYLIRRDIRPPSGGRLGEIVEKTHHDTIADVNLTSEVLRVVNGDTAREIRADAEQSARAAQARLDEPGPGEVESEP